ncbi:MAG: Major facilitator superfamily MFS1 [Limisphaerales bacterium]|nr:MAG: Major facilitator superfamily MFS1 [Limisphaerales bacterium]KAG0509976.1 MAG: Major facilitator superfamily MFS1 [Limisphaerales bacterium]TXT53134.1 MAG: Major facilitator superfamily MFS1 [Limisphaerales bacterium]
MDAPQHRVRTLWLLGVLHAFTHVYHVALLPLYLPMQRDLKLSSLEQATLPMTVMMLVYYGLSYPLGILADRVSRKKLLGWGLFINALGFVGLALAPNYPAALASVVIAAIGGSCFHPAATALVARLYPEATGRALGLVGIGAGAGFFVGPIYAGWRATQSGDWRTPVLEFGVLGIVAAGAFAWLADESSSAGDLQSPSSALAGPNGDCKSPALFPSPALWLLFLAAAVAFALRDFAGHSMGSLGSLFLQKAHGFTVKEAGAALSVIFLMGVVSNPLFGHLSDRGRTRWTAGVMVAAAVVVAAFPHLPRGWLTGALAVYGFFFMGCYPMVEAALMESVPDAVRGRVFGLFITVGGILGNLAHWFAGRWVEHLGADAGKPASYHAFYLLLAALLVASLPGLLCLREIRKRERM